MQKNAIFLSRVYRKDFFSGFSILLLYFKFKFNSKNLLSEICYVVNNFYFVFNLL